LLEQIERAGEDDTIKAILFEVDSPGGDVGITSHIHRQITEMQEEYEKPIYERWVLQQHLVVIMCQHQRIRFLLNLPLFLDLLVLLCKALTLVDFLKSMGLIS